MSTNSGLLRGKELPVVVGGLLRGKELPVVVGGLLRGVVILCLLPVIIHVHVLTP
jgi:hypothetical protein